MTGILKQAMSGAGAIVGVVGPPGIGKSRIASELSDIAARGGAEVFTTYCEAHAGDIPFHAVARLLRAAFGVTGTTQVRHVPAYARDSTPPLPTICAARRPARHPRPRCAGTRNRPRRATAPITSLINTASLARTTPTVYLIEDAHWIDDVSDSMLADFLAVTPQTPRDADHLSARSTAACYYSYAGNADHCAAATYRWSGFACAVYRVGRR